MSVFDYLFSFNSLVVLLGTAILGCACGVVGSFTVLRERALIGDCVAHASLPGICIAFLILRERTFLPLFLGAIVAGLLSAWCISVIRHHTRIKEDSAIALVLTCFFGLGITLSRLIQNLPGGARAGLDSFIFGKAATMSLSDVETIAVVAAAVLLVSYLLRKEFALLCFDKEFAFTQGYPVRLLDILLMTLVCLCTAAGLPAVGAVMVVALLVFPAVTARLWTDTLSTMLLLSGAFGVISCVAGVALSATIPASFAADGLPTGPLIVVCAGILFVFSLLVAPRHGLYHQRWRLPKEEPRG
jgi:manganese/zinc/iron transport system permease protein